VFAQANLRAVLSLAAQLRGTPEAQLAQLTWDNSRRLFRACLPEPE
jgi:Tat protein secretion system quality control protein TatD with DNase activity